MSVVDPEKFEVAFKIVRDKLKEVGLPDNPIAILPFRERVKGSGDVEGVLISRVLLDGEMKTVACGWTQKEMHIDWSKEGALA